MARRYAWTYRWASASIDHEDLVQDAYEKMIQAMGRALSVDNPIAYLIGSARSSIMCTCYRMMRDLPMESLDAAVPGWEDTLLADLIAESGFPLPAYAADEGSDYQPLYQAIEHLPEKEQAVIERRYGIGCHAPVGLAEIGRDCQWTIGMTQHYWQEAVGTLFLALSEAYPTYSQDNIPFSENNKKASTRTAFISDHQRQRLESAYDALLSRGGKVTCKALQQEARIDADKSQAYLRERRVKQPHQEVERKQRLDGAHATLMGNGTGVTIETLAREAHVGVGIAKLYLRKLKPEDPLEGRIEQATAFLQSQGQAVTIAALARQAHAAKRTVSAYLQRVSAARAVTQP